MKGVSLSIMPALMKRISIIALVTSVVSLLVSSCNHETSDSEIADKCIFSSSFITWFYTMDEGELILETYDKSKSTYTFIWQGGYSDYYTKDHNPNEYDNLCDKYGDRGLNAYLEIGNQASTNSFSRITVTSDIDFPGHPAGSDLSDIVFVRMLSAKQFIDSGYSDKYLRPYPVMIEDVRVITATEGWTKIYKLAKDVTKEDLTLLARDFRVEFHDKPLVEDSDALITVKLEQEGADTIIGSCRVNFSHPDTAY